MGSIPILGSRIKIMDKENLTEKIQKLEAIIVDVNFWADKNKAQNILKELAELKAQKEGVNKYDKGNAIVTVISGAGGEDAEDFMKIKIIVGDIEMFLLK